MNKKDQQATLLLMQQILSDYTKVPHLKPVKGKRNHSRVRVGNYRIIFKVLVGGTAEIRRIIKRNEATYKNL